MAKLLTEPDKPVVEEEDVPPHAPFFGSRYRRIRVFHVEGETNTVPLHLGDYPWVYRPRDIDVVIPEIYISVLDDSRSPSFRMVEAPADETGNVFRTVPFTIQRFPYQDLGKATRAEFEADEAKYARKAKFQ
jgi:hypothetical protein